VKGVRPSLVLADALENGFQRCPALFEVLLRRGWRALSSRQSKTMKVAAFLGQALDRLSRGAIASASASMTSAPSRKSPLAVEDDIFSGECRRLASTSGKSRERLAGLSPDFHLVAAAKCKERKPSHLGSNCLPLPLG